MVQSVVTRAAKFAADAHEGSFRKGSSLPYIVHPMEAAAIVAGLTSDEEVIAAALLHDVIEDTPFTAEDICKDFGERVAELVKGESENKREELPAELTWRIRKEENIAHLCTSCIEMKMIALGDKLSNIRSMQRDYASLGEELWQRFNQKDKAQHGWYYRSMCDAVSELSHTEAWKELDRLIKEIFE